MRPARLDLAIRSAMRSPGTDEQPAAPQAGQAAGPPPQRRFAFVRRLLARSVGPIAHYARRYLQAPVEHELREARDRMGALSGDLADTRHRLHEAQTSLDALLSAQGQATRILQAQTVHMQIMGEQLADLQAQSARAVDEITRLPGLFGPRFDEIEIKQRPLIAYDDESMAIRMRDGYVMAPRALPTFVTMLANATSRGLEPGTGDVLRRLIQPGMVVADVGANIGLLTLVCAWATGPTGRVVAFEPEAIPRSNLEKMKYLNGLSWVEVRDQAVGAAAGRLTFHVSDIIGHSSLYALPDAEEARTMEVEVIRLDDAAAGKRMDVVKIDVEGAELDVLAGMSGLIGKNPDLAVVAEFGPEHLKRVGQTPAIWFKAFADAGFKPYIIDETSGDCEPTSARAAAKVVSANIAFVRAGGAAERRLLKR